MFNIVKFKVLEDDDVEEDTNMFCDICGYILTSQEDHEHHSKYNHCHECYLTFIEGSRHEWYVGKRPKQDVLDKYLMLRSSIYQKIGEKSEL